MSIISFDIYKNAFERLLEDSTISQIDLDAAVEDLILQIPLDAKKLEQTPFLIRSSVLDKNEVCTNIKRCSYVPDCFVDKIPLQRCNFEKQQVFYANIPGITKNFLGGANTSLMETVFQKINDEPSFDNRDVAVSRWQVKEQPTFWTLPYFANSIKTNQDFKFLYTQYDDFLKSNCQSLKDYQNFTNKLNYLSELFCRNDNKQNVYKITATYFNKVMTLFKPHWGHLDALIYASANTKGEGMNIVLTKDYVDRKSIYCDLVILYKINREKDDNKSIWFDPYAQASPDEFGNLEFKPLHKSMIN